MSVKHELADANKSLQETRTKLEKAKNLLGKEQQTSMDIRSERDDLENSLSVARDKVTATKKKARIFGIGFIVAVLLLVAVIVFPRFPEVRDIRYRSLVRDIREECRTVPTLADSFSDSVRYAYEDLMGEQW